jgi:2-polyprenyl-3-methyl-5-hydroxy-6-metoxy-1,4-benzoquinol methylase
MFDGERCIPECMSNKIKIYQHHLARYNFSLIYARNKKVLDAACGAGYGTNLLYDVTKSILGVDVSAEAIEHAKNKYRGEFEVCNLENSFPNGNFDIAISFETIEHLDNPDVFISNIKEKCSEFVFSIPLNLPSTFHKKVYTMESAKALIEKFYDKDKIFWSSQNGININKKARKGDKYLIGYAKN